jgi:MraZ protein
LAESSEIVVPKPEAPFGIRKTTVDDKGRLKFPVEYLEYLKALEITKLFCTTLDLKLARIYPIEVWRRNEKLFREGGAHTKAANRMAFLAEAHGDAADVDAAGRLLLPAKLRAVLDLEKQPVFLRVFKDRIDLMTQKAYDECMTASTANAAEDLETLEALGLN